MVTASYFTDFLKCFFTSLTSFNCAEQYTGGSYWIEVYLGQYIRNLQQTVQHVKVALVFILNMY